MIRIEMTSRTHPEFWRLAYAYEEYLMGKFGRPSRIKMSSTVFNQFMREVYGFETVKAISSECFGTFYIDETEYVWFSLKFL